MFSQSSLYVNSQRSYGGENNDNAYAIAETSDGGFILAGSTRSNNSYDVPASKAYNSSGGDDFWLIKTSANGTLEWSKTFGGSKDDVATGIAKTINGEYVIVGTTMSVDGDANFNGPNGGLLILRIKENGELLSKRVIPGGQRFTQPTFHYANEFSQPSVKVAPNGNIFIGATYEIGSSPYLAKQFYLTKLTPTGDTFWEKYYGSSIDDQMQDLVIASNGDVLMVGSTTAFSNQIEGAGNGNLDFLAIKVNENGQEIWKKGWGGSNIDALHGAIENNTKTGFILVGETTSKDGIVTTPGGQKDAFIFEIDYNGNIKWKLQPGGDGNDNLYNIISDSDQSYVAFGTSDSNIKGVPSKGSLTDVFTVKLSNAGSITALGLFGGEDIDVARDGIKYSRGGFALASISRSEFEDVSTNNGENDFWLLNLTPPPPIIFSYFRGELDSQNQGVLEWKTTIQKDATIIRLEKSLDGRNYSRLKDYSASSNMAQTYSYTDSNVPLGQNFYRLKFFGKDGKEYAGPSVTINHSPLALQQPEENELDVSFYPNPVKDKLIVPIKDGNVMFTLYDILGNNKSFYAQFSPHTGWVFDLSEMKSGSYVLKSTLDDKTVTKRFVIH